MNMDIKALEREIKTLEQSETTWANIEKLSLLYNIYDHIRGDAVPILNGSSNRVMPKVGEDEFCKTCQGTSIEPLMAVLSEHMAAIKVLHPKEYEAVLEKIRGIS